MSRELENLIALAKSVNGTDDRPAPEPHRLKSFEQDNPGGLTGVKLIRDCPIYSTTLK